MKFFVKVVYLIQNIVMNFFQRKKHSLHVKSWITMDWYKGIYYFCSIPSFWGKNSFFVKNGKTLKWIYFSRSIQDRIVVTWHMLGYTWGLRLPTKNFMDQWFGIYLIPDCFMKYNFKWGLGGLPPITTLICIDLVRYN